MKFRFKGQDEFEKNSNQVQNTRRPSLFDLGDMLRTQNSKLGTCFSSSVHLFIHCLWVGSEVGTGTVGERRRKGSFRGSSLKRPHSWNISKFGSSSVFGWGKEEGSEMGEEGGRKRERGAASTEFKFSYFLMLVVTIGRH